MLFMYQHIYKANKNELNSKIKHISLQIITIIFQRVSGINNASKCHKLGYKIKLK